MHLYDGPTPKRHYAYSNSSAVLRLDRGKLSGWKTSKKQGQVKTAVTYKNGQGKSCYKGTAALRKSEYLGLYLYKCFRLKPDIYNAVVLRYSPGDAILET